MTFHEEALLDASKHVERIDIGRSSRATEVELDVLDEKENGSGSFQVTEDSQTLHQIGRLKMVTKSHVRFGVEDMTT